MQNRARIRALVETAMGPKEMWAGKTYTFERRPDSSEFPDVKQEEDRWVIAVNGRRLSWASSARQNKDAAELGIETAAEFRRRGLGRQVAAAWARAMLGEGRVAFYSHTLDNRASEKLARSLGVHPRFVFVGY